MNFVASAAAARLLGLALLLIATGACSAPPAPLPTYTPYPTYTPSVPMVMLHIADDFFQESELVVVRGTRVTWVNQGANPHSVTSGSTSAEHWDTGLLAPGQAGQRVFSTIGQFSYYCKVHEFMNATIRVI